MGELSAAYRSFLVQCCNIYKKIAHACALCGLAPPPMKLRLSTITAGWGWGRLGLYNNPPCAEREGMWNHRGTSLLLRFGTSSGLLPFSGSLVIRPFSGSPRARAPARSTTAEVKKVHYGPTGTYVGRRASCTDHRPPPSKHATLLKGARGRGAGAGLGFW